MHKTINAYSLTLTILPDEGNSSNQGYKAIHYTCESKILKVLNLLAEIVNFASSFPASVFKCCTIIIRLNPANLKITDNAYLNEQP